MSIARITLRTATRVVFRCGSVRHSAPSALLRPQPGCNRRLYPGVELTGVPVDVEFDARTPLDLVAARFEDHWCGARSKSEIASSVTVTVAPSPFRPHSGRCSWRVFEGQRVRSVLSISQL